MDDSAIPRLASALLEDMAIVALTARPGEQEINLHPQLSDSRRATLRARLKHISRHEWPATLRDDPLLRRGYTLRQCFRLLTVLLLLDGQLPPGLAVPLAANNEADFMTAILTRLSGTQNWGNNTVADPMCVIVLGELWEQVDEQAWVSADPLRVRLVERQNLHQCWSTEQSMEVAGQRLIIDIGTPAAAVWAWMRSRRFMPEVALTALANEVSTEVTEGVPKPKMAQVVKR